MYSHRKDKFILGFSRNHLVRMVFAEKIVEVVKGGVQPLVCKMFISSVSEALCYKEQLRLKPKGKIGFLCST